MQLLIQFYYSLILLGTFSTVNYGFHLEWYIVVDMKIKKMQGGGGYNPTEFNRSGDTGQFLPRCHV